MMYCYKYFCYIIETNFPCIFLKKIQTTYDGSRKKIKILLTKNDAGIIRDKEDNFKYKQNETEFLGAYNDLSFRIVWSCMTIIASANDIDSAFLTLLNVPVALLIAFDGNLVLHCSTVLKGNKLYSFFGPKGIGKTTKSMSMIQNDENAVLYSDDSLCISFDDNMAYSNYSVLKITDYTKKVAFNEKNNQLPLYFKNEKTIYYLDYNGSAIPITNVNYYFLFRNENACDLMYDDISIFTYLLSKNIIGINYMSQSLLEIVESRVLMLAEKAETKINVLYIANAQK